VYSFVQVHEALDASSLTYLPPKRLCPKELTEVPDTKSVVLQYPSVASLALDSLSEFMKLSLSHKAFLQSSLSRANTLLFELWRLVHLPRTAREIPKEISAFGEKQFQDTGADLVEVLRVKASTMRKHFKQLKGISFLVSVIQTDRVRVYFFTSSGALLIGENLNHDTYTKVRKTSKLVTKFVKPKPPTEEELRMEATEELRQQISRTLRRTARSLGRPEPSFPQIYVSRASLDTTSQKFGVQYEDDGSVIFEQVGLDSAWAPGVLTRASFMQLLNQESRNSEIGNAIANGFAYASLSKEAKSSWLEIWKKHSKETELVSFVGHLIKHAETYRWEGYMRFLHLLESLPDSLNKITAEDACSAIHDNYEVTLGHDERMTILGFCNSLEKPKKLASRRYVAETIHLSPRVICDPTPIGITLHAVESLKPKDVNSDWLNVHFLAGKEQRCLTLLEKGENIVESFHYMLRLDDVFPKSGGIMSHGRDVLGWILEKLGVESNTMETYEAALDLSGKELGSAEIAVLERLCEGGLKVLSDTMVGSPQRISTLLTAKRIVFLPDFHHLGLKPSFLVSGEKAKLEKIMSYCLEATLIGTSGPSYMIAAAPNIWRQRLLEAVLDLELAVWPILKAESKRRIIRSESNFGEGIDVTLWSESSN
jgi:hypothetical protein